ncbi:uncharacterized protein E0L32_008190 [Thyridium curvatum]|uniref:Enolase-phosphatase E1 n=1 Tax=Thyridium curvatum TaxID=1093900 RepID=A0A507B0Z5_9PEZI|nr:uncharacterized protein E0L32_008190 [Thyridium curvatum]TPX10801.1 hypothetical protein E0L32_008190 [Thyridium curvatum]
MAASSALSTIKVVMLDIEGTVCPISFVKDVLFPYALDALPGTLESKWDSPEFAPYRDAFPAEYASSPSAFADHVRDLASRDVKVAYLKSLQGYLWETGYRNGEIKAPLFPDVAPQLASWAAAGIPVMIYSSGSVPAQKLLFAHTDGRPADLTPLITDYFDTVNAGPKTQAASYAAIAARYPAHPREGGWLFLSDNVAEVEAAARAGMQSFVVQRPGNAPLPEGVEARHTVTMSSASFDRSTTGTEVARVFKDHIKGKRVLITGASPNSLGEATALAIARSQPALLILASRTRSKLDAVASRLVADGLLPSASVRTVELDLCSQASVRAAAAAVAGLTPRLDVLINNAGINTQHRRLSPEGVEATFATNHVGPFLLTTLLLPLLRAAAADAAAVAPGETRIVNVSSDGHRLVPMRFSDYNLEGKAALPDELPRSKALPDWFTKGGKGYSGVLAYNMSKTAAVLLTVGLKQRLRAQGIQSFAANPGTIRTPLMRDIQPELRDSIETLHAGEWKSPDQGCAPFLVAAFDPSLSGSDEVYVQQDCQLRRPSAHAADVDKAERLWVLSEALTGAGQGASRL